MAAIDVKKNKDRFLSAFDLKLLAIITMFIDHIAVVYFDSINDYSADIYTLMRNIGRFAFPVFCFFIVEGYFHTRNLKKYLLRLFIFGIISQVPYTLAIKGGKLFYWGELNIYFTLFLGLIAVALCDKLGTLYVEKKNRLFIPLIILSLHIVFWAAIYFEVSYGLFGILLVLIFYYIREDEKYWNNDKMRLLIMGLRFVAIYYAIYYYSDKSEIWAMFSVAILFLYNGKRGRRMKWVFYLFYPAHLLVLYFSKVLLHR